MPKISEAGKDAWAVTARTGASVSASAASYTFNQESVNCCLRQWTPRGEASETYSSESGAGKGLEREKSQREEAKASHLERDQRDEEGREDELERDHWAPRMQNRGSADYATDAESGALRSVLRSIFFTEATTTR